MWAKIAASITSMADDTVMPYVWCALVFVLALATGILGWTVNGWRLKADSSAKDVEITRLTGELSAQNLAIEALASESRQARAVASMAQAEATRAKVRAAAKTKIILSTPASSCGVVVRDQWGRI